MKNCKRILCVALAATLALSMGACGKKNKTDANGTSVVKTMTSDEMKNFVYKEESLEFINSENSSSLFFNGENLYVVEMNYHYADGNNPELYIDDMPIARDFDIEKTADGEVEEEVIMESEEVEASEEAMFDDAEAADAEGTVDTEETSAKKRVAGNVSAEAADAESEEGDIANEEGDIAGEEGDIPDEAGENSTEEEYVDCVIKNYKIDGTVVYEYTNRYSINSSLYNFKADNNGNLFFIREDYGFNEKDGSYHDDFYLVCLDTAGKEKWEKVIGSSTDDVYFYTGTMYQSDDKMILSVSDGAYIVDASGDLKHNEYTSSGNNDIGEVIPLRNGEVVAAVWGEADTEYHKYDVTTGEVKEKLEVPALFSRSSISAGLFTDFALSTNDGVYTYNLGDSEPKKVMDFVASDLVMNNLTNISFIDENSFYGEYYDYVNDKETLSKFTKVDPSQIKDKTILTLGGLWIDNDIREAVINFNKQSDDTKILINDFSWGMTDYDQILSTVNNAIVTGNIPDILVMSNDLSFENYASKGLFEDLNPYFEKDPELNRSDYMENVLDVCSMNGKLYGLCSNFYIQTAFAKKSIVGDIKSWTMEDYNKISAQFGDGKMDFGLLSKSDFVQLAMMYNADQFVDWGTGKVNLNSPEFIDVLKYTDKLPLEVDYESDEVNEYWEKYDTVYREDRSLVYVSNIYNMKDFNYTEQGMFGEPVAIVGFPCSGNHGSALNTYSLFCISSKSKNKDKAWEMIREFISDEYQDKVAESSFPIKKSAQKVFKEAAKQKPFYMDGDKKVFYDDSYFVGGEEVIIKPLTDAQCEELLAFASSITTKVGSNEGILNIINEEAQAYYSGAKSVEDVVKVIQNRVQIYVDENR